MMGERHTVFLSAGSNLGDRKANLEWALGALAAEGIEVMRVSSIFETEPVGFLEQPWFLNIAVEAETLFPPTALLDSCLDIERRCGRVRTFRGAPRALDIDILLYGGEIFEQPSLIIPHPRMIFRKFVLLPMAEIAPEVVHPALGKTVRELLAACSDTSTVRHFPNGEAS